MALQFRIHADTEHPASGNNGSIKSQQGGPPAIRAKTFVDTKTPVAATPRKALGLVNRNEVPSVKTTQPLKIQSQHAVSSQVEKRKLFTPSKADSRKSGDSKRVKTRQPLSVQQENVAESNWKSASKPHETTTCAPVCASAAGDSDDMEIDTVQPPSTQRDTYEDIIPVEEQASTFLSKLFKWPPPCLFGVQPDSDDEADEKVDSHEFIRKLDMLPKPLTSPLPEQEEVVDLDKLLEEEDEEEVPLPCIDEDSLSQLMVSTHLADSPLHSDSVDMNISTSLNNSACLDDSAPSPKLGSLQLQDDVTGDV